jgi:peptidoglycan hydrolase-like protein with peptidoglycan-binding domain
VSPPANRTPLPCLAQPLPFPLSVFQNVTVTIEIMRRYAIACLALTVLATGCRRDSDIDEAAHVYWTEERLTREELERGRLDPSWRQVVNLDTLRAEALLREAWDTAAPGLDSDALRESWDAISRESVEQLPMRLPLGGDGAGPSILRLQILLDRAVFSPGIIDGRWGKNTEKAVYWLQERERLEATGVVDGPTFQRLADLAGNPPQLVRQHRLNAHDVEGPFVRIPDDIYERAEMQCMCYESLTEKLTEMFHVHADVLRQLNPDVELDELSEGDVIVVPNTRQVGSPRAPIERIVVSRRGHFVHAMDAAGRIVYHFPSTLGSSYDPSPEGDYRVVRITKDPWWHYQPAILAHVPDNQPDARIPPGPNNAVGRVWMALSKPHYGIHGTNAPETIGYATSAGCVRLTNWDALFLADRIDDGVAVEFRDI